MYYIFSDLINCVKVCSIVIRIYSHHGKILGLSMYCHARVY